MEKIKFYSNRFEQNIECEILEKRKKTWKLKTPKGTFQEVIIKTKTRLLPDKKNPKILARISSLVPTKIKTTMEEKIIVKHIKQLGI